MKPNNKQILFSVLLAILMATAAYAWNPPNRYTVTTDTVEDSITGLMWQRQSGNNANWSYHLGYCQNLNHGSYTDWRLPNIKELASIVDDRYEFPAFDATVFIGSGNSYWSSTPAADGTLSAYVLDFYRGDMKIIATNFSLRARCVRNP